MPTTNNDYDWLTYESVFNKPDFRKSNKKYELGLYLIPRDKVTVWFRNNIDAELLTKLTDAFFPDYESDKHLKASNQIWDWKEVVGAGTVEDAVSPVGIFANRGVIIVHKAAYVVLPYNFYDNDGGSRALGTAQSAGLIQLKSDQIWDFWKTASRSNVVRLKRIKDKGAAWDDKKEDPWTDWNFAAGEADRGNPAGLLKDSEEPTRYKLTSYTKNDVSLKTGVIFVGSQNQKAASKDFLDDNWIVAGLRSDYVVTVDEEMKGKRHEDSKKQDIVILTELLSINEIDKRVEGKYKDGVQVRDLSQLDRANLYLAPLNIPFINLEFNEFQEEFACLDDKAWCDYWKRHWAASLGGAKALFLVRYGLQHINPNVQNYMIEFKTGAKPVPTGRIIIRDLQDASLHREVVWALYGPESEAPPEGEDKKDELKKLKLKLLKYEFNEVKYYQETGSTDKQFGPPGTQFLWQRFSSFANGDKIFKYKEVEPFKSKWKELLATMTDWGRAHNRAYVGCIERQLGVNFTEIKWGDIPDPDRYRNLPSIDRASSECMSVSYGASSSSGAQPPRIALVNVSNLPWSKPNWEKTLVAPFEAAKMSKPCVLINGDGFQNPEVRIDDVEVAEILISKDGKQIFAMAETDSRTLVAQKKAAVVINNYERAGKINLIGSVTCETLKGGDMGWEENAARIVHDYLRGPAGQAAIRAYKGRGWQPQKPAFGLRFTDPDKKPIEFALVEIASKDYQKRWTDMADINGEIRVYDGAAEDYRFLVKEYCKNPVDAGEIKRHGEVIMDHFHGRKLLHVHYLDS
ncbi:MAG: hypothetical protein R2747_22690 [Pyrinomonadaceae bacterium]